jgi:hypothetical protein
MNASTLFAAIAAIAFAGSAFAADVPAANATTTAAAAAAVQVSAAAQAPAAAAAVAKPAGPTRAQIRAEAEEAARTRRSTEASQFDWFMSK